MTNEELTKAVLDLSFKVDTLRALIDSKEQSLRSELAGLKSQHAQSVEDFKRNADTIRKAAQDFERLAEGGIKMSILLKAASALERRVSHLEAQQRRRVGI